MLQLKILTPHKTYLHEQVDSVNIPGLKGEMQILPMHISLITLIYSGILTYHKDNKTQHLVVHHGIGNVHKNEVSILVSICEFYDNIDTTRAKKAQQISEEKLLQLKEKQFEVTFKKFEAKLARSLSRQKSF